MFWKLSELSTDEQNKEEDNRAEKNSEQQSFVNLFFLQFVILSFLSFNFFHDPQQAEKFYWENKCSDIVFVFSHEFAGLVVVHVGGKGGRKVSFEV